MSSCEAVVLWGFEGSLRFQGFATSDEGEAFASSVGGVVFHVFDGQWELLSDFFGTGEFVPVCGGAL